ncbi:uncharacterized protein LOC123406981 [Hordeum vulgare subsp. vulgare]|uniref:Predicted protein n=1 Tax=Hordeum vulgare subsp. vulgare TaxID=112509 RepID=F2EB92_HORVV|nr:uncharacterized protein LOC123406981 [Hordeum vulgare subsp. vulgare]BAK04614.1 predicted protein [Hordeum vulgare subsp. vulgare]
MTGGGGARSPAQAARGRRQKAASLPLDVLVDIAAHTDPATFVRCAATCVDMRCRVKEYISLRHPLRLRQGDRFVLPLLRGHLMYRSHDWSEPKEQLFLMDTSAPDATKLRTATGGGFPLSSRDGLVLARVGAAAKELRVCDPATGRSMTLPPEPAFPRTWGANYVLLVSDDDKGGTTSVGRHFQVVKAYLNMSEYGGYLHLQFQTFSSEHGAWGLYTETWLPYVQCGRLKRSLDKALVTGGAVHWLFMTDTGFYVLKLRVGAAKVMVTKLPKGFPHHLWEHQKLLAASSVGGDVLVLVADDDRMSVWAQSKHTAKWKQRPHVVINMTETILRFLDKEGGGCIPPTKPVGFSLVSFAEKSGTVLIKACNGFFWLDLRTMEIVRWFWDHGVPYTTHNIPYEISLTAWVPTFSSTL